MYTRLLEASSQSSFFLFGPRGTGKSTWVRATFPDAVYLDLLDARLTVPLTAAPDRLRDLIPAEHDGWVVIDEVQKAPALLDEVHRLIESRGLRFVLTGSSARKLRRGGVNLLAGRALTKAMHPLTVRELGDDFSLARSLRTGHLPMALAGEEPDRYLAAFVQTYLREEVMHEGLTRNLGAFTRFLEAASFSQGSPLNVTEVARDAGVHRKVVEGYFGIVDDLLLGSTLPVFTKRAKRRMTARPKFWFFDAGVYRALRPRGPLDRPEEIEGIALETLVYQELRALNDYLELGYDLYFWRTSHGVEVDFVCYGPRGLVAIEVKRAAKLRSRDLKGLEAFCADYPQATALLLYGGDRPLQLGSVRILPIEDGLRTLGPLLAEPPAPLRAQ